MVKLLLVAEMDHAVTREDSERILDAFRESVRPESEYGIVLYQARLEDIWDGSQARLKLIKIAGRE